MSQTRILIVHDDNSTAALMTSMLQALGHRIDEAPNDRVAVRMLEHSPVDLVLAGANPDDADALEFLTYVRRKAPHVPVILVFSSPHPERTREAQIRGAAAVLRFPVPANVLRAAVAQALGMPETTPSKPSHTMTDTRSSPTDDQAIPSNGHGHSNGNGHARLRFEMGLPPMPLSAPAPSSGGESSAIVGEDPALVQAIEMAGTIAASRGPVLIMGERGAGKTLLARTLHARSNRPEAPFVKVACGSLSEEAFETELFGRAGTSYAPDERPGKVALARGGTLYLDEVSALSNALQVKILRLLCDGEYQVPGSDRVERADVRLILGTREDLPSLVSSSRFRMDLHYRISVVTLKLPPLRHRGADIARLADHFRDRSARRHGKDIRSFSPESIDLLKAHGWPGNVQELEQVIERAVIVCRGARIEPNHLALIPRDLNAPRSASRIQKARVGSHILPLKEALEEPEKQLILEALEALNWNRQETARVLDINRTTLYKKMKKYGLLFDEPVWAN